MKWEGQEKIYSIQPKRKQERKSIKDTEVGQIEVIK